MREFIRVHWVYLAFWLAMLVAARLWLVNPIVHEIRMLSERWK